MKVRCIKNDRYMNLTFGKTYEVFDENRLFYYVEDDNGDVCFGYLKKHFEEIEDPDRITALEEANGQLTDRLIKLEKEVLKLKKPATEFILAIDESDEKDKAVAVLARLLKNGEIKIEASAELQGTAPELTEEIHPKPYELHTVVVYSGELVIGYLAIKVLLIE